MSSWIWGYDREKYNVIKAPYEDINRDYFTSTEQPEVYYGIVKTNIDDYFKFARDVSAIDFASHQRNDHDCYQLRHWRKTHGNSTPKTLQRW